MGCPADVCICFAFYLCFIYPNLAIYLGIYVYAPCMTSNRFVATKCRIVDISLGKGSNFCYNIKVEYEDPRESTESRTIGNLCPNERSFDDKGWVWTYLIK